MLNIKKFSLVAATAEQLELYAGASALFLQSEDGRDWYACQPEFADDTVKIQYDADGVILMVIDAPVPARGNVYAVSMLWPIDCSVAEIAVADYPAGVTLDGSWKFDEATQSVYQDSDIVATRTLAANTVIRDNYALKATLAISAIQCSLAAGNPRPDDSDNLLLLQQYVDKLRDVTLSAPTWPPQPAVMGGSQ